MLFEKIATGLTKHYKKVIVIWIIALLIAVPAILQVNSVVEYSSSNDAGQDNESLRAQRIIQENFQRSVANGTLLVLLQADNVTDPAVRDFVLALQERVRSSPDVRYFENVSSIYTYSEQVLGQAVLQLGPGLYAAEEQVNTSAFMLWGIPALHASNFAQTGSDAQAYAVTSAQLAAYLEHADEATRALALSYYGAFANAWNATAGDPVLVADPAARATFCVNNVAPAFINGTPLPSEQKQVMLAVLNTFDLSTFSDRAAVHSFALNMVGAAASISNMTFLQQVYDLGPAYDEAEAAMLARTIVSTGTLSSYPIALPSQLTSNFVSPNGRTMLLLFTFSVSSSYYEGSDQPLMDDVGVLRNDISQLKAETGAPVTVYVTGDAAISEDMRVSSENDMKMIEPITIVIILVLMGVLFRTVVGQFLPLGAVGVAVGLSQAMVFVIGSFVAQINYTVITMLFAILMGVGTDYSIFIVSRYREERTRGADRKDAVHASVTWAGESIVTSGATVIIAFFAMSLSSFSMVQSMGLVLGLSIIIALLVALTLVPAILMLVGNRVFWPISGKRFQRYAEKVMSKKRAAKHGYFHRAASFSVKHAKVVVLAAILVSVPTSYLFVTQETSFDFIGSMGNPESIQGMNAMTDDFGAGKIMPTQVVIVGDTLVYDNTTGTFDYAYLDAIDNITATIAAESMVQQVTGMTRPYGEWIDYRNLSALPAETRAQIEQAMLGSLGDDSRSVLLTVVLKDQPEAASSVNFIPPLRDKIADAQAAQPALASSTILVGGTTAMTHDMSLVTSQQFTNIEILVVIGIFIVLMIVLGSILLPLFAIVSIAMSITWAFAATYLVFGAWLGMPILWLIPLILFVMLMGIGMDYNVFILTRIKEEAHKGKDTKQAVIDAVDWTGGIITALALIMAGAFGSIMLSSNAMLQEFGFALFLAVLLDAMVVRTYIVPAAVVLMGKWAWWAPGPLQRVGRREKVEEKEPETAE